MRKQALIILTTILILPILVRAELCDESSYPFRLCTIIQNFTNVIAGNPTNAIISFKYIGNDWAPLVIRVNISSSGYTFTEKDFKGIGVLRTRSIIGANEREITLTCELPPIQFIQTGDEYESYLPNVFTLYCFNPEYFYIVMPASTNRINITLIPNIGLIPSTFNFTIELMSDVGIPILEPDINIVNGYGNLSINPPYEKLEFYFGENQNLTIKTLVYSSVFIKKVPSERPYSLIYFDFRNSTPFNGVAQVRYYFDPDLLEARGWDKNNIRFYRFNGTHWILMNSGVVDNYVWVNLTKFSLYGVFTSFYYPPAQAPVYNTYEETYIYPVYVTNVTNITQVIERPIERVIEKEKVPEAVCGNGYCESGETCSNCPEDCRCPAGTECRNNVCVAVTQPSGGIGTITGAVVAILGNPLVSGLISLAIIVIVIFVFREKLFKKTKFK